MRRNPSVWAIIGTLTPGKYADLLVIRAEDINNMPLNNAIGTIVLATETPISTWCSSPDR